MNQRDQTYRRTALIILCSLFSALASSPARADAPSATYKEAMARSVKLERAGEHSRAVTALQAIEQDFPQDYALQLRLGWLSFLATDYTASEDHYRQALVLSPAARDARHGLAWALLRQDKRAAARAQFQIVTDQWPSVTLARQGLSMSQEPAAVTAAPTAYLTGQIYSGHPYKSGALGLTTALPLRILEHGVLSATYRYSHYWGTDTSGADTTFDQHEVYLAGGVSYARFGLTGHYAYASDDSGYLDGTHAVGLTARFSPWGDIKVATSLGLFSDMTVLRVATSWRLPLTSWLSVTPGVSVQVASADDDSLLLGGSDQEALVAGTLDIVAHNARGSVWVGGSYGDQVRTVDLVTGAIYNTTDRTNFTARAGASLNLLAGWSLFANYELQSLQTALSTDSSTSSYLHLMTLGASWSF